VSLTSAKSAIGGAYRSGRARARGCAIVLTYHRVGSCEPDPHQLNVSLEHFEEQVRVVVHEHETLTAGELAALMRDGSKLPQRAVVLTFDDGYAETHAAAVPILVDLALRATSFLCSDFVGSEREYPWDTSDRDGETGAATAPRPSRRILSAAEVRALHRGGVIEIGAHTRTHPTLSALTPEEQSAEILGGKAALESIVGAQMSTFAYPQGGPDKFDAESVRLTREAGFDAAFTTAPGIVLPRTNRYTVPRFHTEDIPGPAFRSLLNGWFDAAR
jgi:peptidoglycan/xylan/chitin deacetylase (PgdA/CDA1 family)